MLVYSFIFYSENTSFEYQTEELVANNTNGRWDSQMSGFCPVCYVWKFSDWHILLLLTSIPLAFWKLWSWLPSQHAALAFFSQDPHFICLAIWHSTEPWSLRSYLPSASIFSSWASSLQIWTYARLSHSLFRTQPKPHLVPEAFWDLSNASGSGLPCTPNTVQLALDSCLSWVLMKSSTRLRAETMSSPSLGVLASPPPAPIRVSSHSYLNVKECTKSVESEGWKWVWMKTMYS